MLFTKTVAMLLSATKLVQIMTIVLVIQSLLRTTPLPQAGAGYILE
jgi:hypothetical protein